MFFPLCYFALMQIPLEIQEQEAFVQWLTLMKLPFFSVPNETSLISRLSKFQKIKFFQKRKREGVQKGVQDVVVFLDHKILFVEMKRTSGSSTSVEQKLWKSIVNRYPYAKAEICKGWIEAKEFIELERKTNDYFKHLEE